MLSLVIKYHWKKSDKIYNSRQIVLVKVKIWAKNLILGQIYRPKWHKFGPKFRNHSLISSLVTTYQWKQSECAISTKSCESKSRYTPKTQFWAKFGPKTRFKQRRPSHGTNGSFLWKNLDVSKNKGSRKKIISPENDFQVF